MATRAQDLMTPDPACCRPHTTLDEVAQLMQAHDCGEIPVIDAGERVIGVVTDRDIVCRIVAAGKNPITYTAESCMSQPAITVRSDAPLQEIVATMEEHQIRRVPVTDERGVCVGIVAQADLARRGPERKVAELLREVSRQTQHASH